MSLARRVTFLLAPTVLVLSLLGLALYSGCASAPSRWLLARNQWVEAKGAAVACLELAGSPCQEKERAEEIVAEIDAGDAVVNRAETWLRDTEVDGISDVERATLDSHSIELDAHVVQLDHLVKR